MGKLFIKVMLKGKLYKHTFIDESIKRDCGIYILLSTKDSKDGQFVCYLNTGHMCVPSTSRLFSCESAKLHLSLTGSGSEKYKFKSFHIPIHAIASYDNIIDKNVEFNYEIELN